MKIIEKKRMSRATLGIIVLSCILVALIVLAIVLSLIKPAADGPTETVVPDIREDEWLDSISCGDSCILIMEGVSMYLSPDELSAFFGRIAEKFIRVSLLMDCYTTFAARASKYKNPINDVGVRLVFGIDEPRSLENCSLRFISEHNMTPDYLIDELSGVERAVFRRVYGGRISKKLYRLYEYEK